MQFEVFDLSLTGFKKARDFQKETFLKVKNKDLPSALILCQHYPVITLGRLTNRNNILISEQELENRGIDVYDIERGGDVTYHGPGQLTVYPIFDLQYFNRDIHKFLRYLEDIVINLLSDFGIDAVRYPGLTGVWVGKQKIASVGIAIKNWITFHGLSINVKKNDLDNFRLIKPCGLDIEMISLECLLGREVEVDSIKDKITGKFKACLPVPASRQAGADRAGSRQGGIYDQSTLAGIR